MKLQKFVFYPQALVELVNTPAGGIEFTLQKVAVSIQTRTQANLSTPYAGPGSRNPAPGPPHRRTGDLVNSVHVGSVGMEDGLVAVPVVSNSVHRGFDYSLWLRENSYEFIRPEQMIQ
jgi:hypothetical protein